jgi:hypothetical protein
VFHRHAAQDPQGVLEKFGERSEALAALYDPGILPTAIGRDEMIKAVREERALGGDGAAVGLGEVRQGHMARHGGLTEDDVLVRSPHGAPLAHTALQGSSDTVIRKSLRIMLLKIAQEGDRLERGVALKHRPQLILPEPIQGIGHGAAAHRLALGRIVAFLDY